LAQRTIGNPAIRTGVERDLTEGQSLNFNVQNRNQLRTFFPLRPSRLCGSVAVRIRPFAKRLAPVWPQLNFQQP
jgi:hypothetical protein